MNTAMNTRWDVLWRDFIGGDESAGGKLFELLFPQMTLTAFSVLKDWELARDQAADVWLKLLETEDKAELRDVRSWCIVAVRNKSMSEIKLRKRRTEIQEEQKYRWIRKSIEADEPMRAKEVESQIERSLDETETKIWQLHYEGYSTKEIALDSSSPKTPSLKYTT